MEVYNGLPEPARVGVLGAGLGVGVSAVNGSDDYLMHALKYGVLSGAAAFVAPMVTADPMYQLGVSGAAGAGAQMLAGQEYVPGSMLMAAGVPSAALWLCRQMS